MPKGKRLQAPEINASSMADIAFLLLIFFLVTTEIVEDQGVLVRLPPWSDEPPPELKLNERNVFQVLVNKNDELLVRQEPAELASIRQAAKNFIMNPGNDPMMALSPQNAIVSLKNDRGTTYSTYVTVYNELLAAYNELWEEESQRRFGTAYEEISDNQKDAIRKDIPLVLSEAEPTSFGEEAGAE